MGLFRQRVEIGATDAGSFAPVDAGPSSSWPTGEPLRANSRSWSTTLELFGLAADPVNQRLVPTPLYLLPHRLTQPPDASKSPSGPAAG